MTEVNNEIQVQAEAANNYEIKKNAEGKFERKAIYQAFMSVRAETRAQKIALLQLLESDTVAKPLNDCVGNKITIADVIISPYDKVNEDTGEMEYGALTYMIDTNGEAYVTSSKSVYYTMLNIFKVFGVPHWEEEEAVTVQVVKKKGLQFNYTDINVIG